MRSVFLSVVASFTLSFATALCGQDQHPHGLTEYQILKSLPKDQLELFGSGVPDAQGLTGTNHSIGSWVEAGPQRGSCRQVMVAVVRDDLATADTAWRGIEVTFSHQLPNGGFEANVRPNGASAKPLGAAVETAYFFLQELGRAVLVIQESPHEAHFHQRIVELEPKMRMACSFINGGYDTIIANSSKAVNRIVIAAKAFGLCGEVLNDPDLVAVSRKLVKHALTLRDSGGVFIEMGGRDSSYNMVSVLFGQVLALHVPLPELDEAFAAPVAWECTQILPSGKIDVSGNTRTGVGKEFGYQGEPKNVNYPEVAGALILYGTVHHDAKALETGKRILGYIQSRDGKTE